jgi:hypothetical protein
MSETQIPTSSATPFDPQPAPAARGGCGRIALLGCGGLLLLTGVAAVIFVLKAKDFVRWGFEKMQAEVQAKIEAKMPPDLTAEDRERLRQAFAAATAKASSGEADQAAMQRLQGELVAVVRKAETGLTRDDVVALTVSLEALGGTAPNAPPGAVTPDAEAPPEPGGGGGEVPAEKPSGGT